MTIHNIDASLGMGSKENLWKDVRPIVIELGNREFPFLFDTLRELGVDLRSRVLQDLTYNNKRDALVVVTTDYFGRMETTEMIVEAPDKTSKALVKMFYQLNYPHNQFYIMSFSFQLGKGDAPHLLTVQSKPKH